MEHGTVLDIHTVPYLYGVDVAAEHYRIPDAAVVSYCYVTYNRCILGYEAILADLGREAPEFSYQSHSV